MIKFFFLIPTLNSSENLSRLVSSFKKQTYEHWRILFVDGFSTKFHRKKLSEICSSSEKFSMIQQNKNEPGIYGAMNQGFNFIREDEWLFFWGDDDWVYSQNTLEKLAFEIYKKKNSGLIVCQGQYVDTKKRKLSRKAFFIRKYHQRILNNSAFRRLLFYGFSPPHQATGFSPELCKKIPYYSKYLELAADLDYFLRISKLNKFSVLTISNKIVFMSNNGISSRKIYKRLLEVSLVYIDSFGIFFFVPLLMRYIRKIMFKYLL